MCLNYRTNLPTGVAIIRQDRVRAEIEYRRNGYLIATDIDTEIQSLACNDALIHTPNCSTFYVPWKL